MPADVHALRARMNRRPDEKRPYGGDADTVQTRSRVERTRLRAAALAARAKDLTERAEAQRSEHESVDVLYELVDRDTEVGGGILAGALAYRLFIWSLPLALVLVAGLGFLAGASSESPESAAKSLGLAGLVSSSVASAAHGTARWYALLVGVPILIYATRGLLRALIASHRLAWTDLRAAAPRPTVGATLRLLGLILAFFVFAALASSVRARSTGLGVLASLVIAIPYAALWLLISIRLPHRDAGWKWLIPGALVVGLGIEFVQLFAAYVLAPWSLNKQGTYGSLGLAAVLLLGLFLVCRLMVGAAVLNATLWDRETRSTGEAGRGEKQARE
jgi:uncharacterized BrkB/YihY/UPF0761 family membrane protein